MRNGCQTPSNSGVSFQDWLAGGGPSSRPCTNTTFSSMLIRRFRDLKNGVLDCPGEDSGSSVMVHSGAARPYFPHG